MPRALSSALHATVLMLAAALILLPLPADGVERYYADAFYPRLQSSLTSWSNTSSVSLFDVLIAIVAGLVSVLWIRAALVAARTRVIRPFLSALLVTLTTAAAMYLWFALAWGLNYARVPIEASLQYDPARVTRDALIDLASTAVVRLNTLHAAAHATGFPLAVDMPPGLIRGLHEVEARLGRPLRTTPGRPKRTLLAPFFRASGVDGMHAPFLLETLVNPYLTPPERPAVLAHEWAHLAGYAPEADASFVGLLAALRADVPSQYSAWLSLFDHAVAQLAAADRRPLMLALAAGPQADRQAIAMRLDTRVDMVARASWQAYDQYLKSQGVDEGVQSYSRVIELLLASSALEWR